MIFENRYNKSMKRLTLYILIVLLFTCGCTKSNLNSDETFSQSKNQEITNHEISLNKEEPQPQEKEQKEELKENLHPIDKAERDCIAKQDSTQGMNECAYKAIDAWYKEIDKYLNLLKTVTSEDEYNNILKAQSKWKEYQEAEFKAVSILINKQGTIYQNIFVGKECGLIKQRAHDLKSFYDYLNEK